MTPSSGGPSFKVAVVGPSRVGKTTLLTAVLSETEDLLAGTQVEVSMDETTRGLVRRQQRDLRRAIEVGEFDAAALGGNQRVTRYHLALHPDGDDAVRIPFELVDYPGGWMDPERRAGNPVAVAEWPGYLDHVRESVMLLVPIDAAVLMEATTPRQKASAAELLELLGVEEVGRKWAMGRAGHPEEPAVLVLAPLKCEKYFADNGGRGTDAAELRRRVRDRYDQLREIVAKETEGRPVSVRTVYAPIDTYGCVELMEARWPAVPGDDLPDFEASYRFRGHPPRIRTRAAGTVMQELCWAVLSGQSQADAAEQRSTQESYERRVARQTEAKGFWGTIEYHLSGESWTVRGGIEQDEKRITDLRGRRAQLTGAARKLVGAGYDSRVELWNEGPDTT